MKASGGKAAEGSPRGRAAMRPRLALIDEALGHGARGKVDRALGIVAQMRGGVRPRRDGEDMVVVVVPLGRVAQRRAVGRALEQAGAVVVVFEDQPGVGFHRPTRLGEFGEEQGRALGAEGMDRVEAQPVHVVGVQPHPRIVAEEGPDDRIVERDRRSPRRLLGRGEERLGIVVEIVPSRAEMIVDDVEHHAEAALMGRIDQRAKRGRGAVAAIGREGQHAVIAPIPAPGEIGDRHDLDHGEAGLREVVEPRRQRREAALRRRGADMDLGDHRFVPGPDRPAAPGRHRLRHDAPPVGVAVLAARGRIGEVEPVGPKAIESAGNDPRHAQLEEAVAAGRHRRGMRAGPQQLNATDARRIEAEHGAVEVRARSEAARRGLDRDLQVAGLRHAFESQTISERATSLIGLPGSAVPPSSVSAVSTMAMKLSLRPSGRRNSTS